MEEALWASLLPRVADKIPKRLDFRKGEVSLSIVYECFSRTLWKPSRMALRRSGVRIPMAPPSVSFYAVKGKNWSVPRGVIESWFDALATFLLFVGFPLCESHPSFLGMVCFTHLLVRRFFKKYVKLEIVTKKTQKFFSCRDSSFMKKAWKPPLFPPRRRLIQCTMSRCFRNRSPRHPCET